MERDYDWDGICGRASEGLAKLCLLTWMVDVRMLTL